MLATRIGRRGQIVLPKEVRMKIKVVEGDQIVFIIDGEQVVIKSITHTLLNMRGRVHVSGKQDFDFIRKQVKLLPTWPWSEKDTMPPCLRLPNFTVGNLAPYIRQPLLFVYNE